MFIVCTLLLKAEQPVLFARRMAPMLMFIAACVIFFMCVLFLSFIAQLICEPNDQN